MVIVYLAHYVDYDWDEVVGVFSTREKAREALRKRKSIVEDFHKRKNEGPKPVVTRYVLDEVLR